MIRTSTELKVIERFDGRGRMYDGEQLIDEVTYALKEFEEVPNSDYSGGQDAREVEVRSLSGIVTPPRLEMLADYIGKRLTLELEDGRRFDFSIARMGDSYCLIKALSRLPR